MIGNLVQLSDSCPRTLPRAADQALLLINQIFQLFYLLVDLLERLLFVGHLFGFTTLLVLVLPHLLDGLLPILQHVDLFRLCHLGSPIVHQQPNQIVKFLNNFIDL